MGRSLGLTLVAVYGFMLGGIFGRSDIFGWFTNSSVPPAHISTASIGAALIFLLYPLVCGAFPAER